MRSVWIDSAGQAGLPGWLIPSYSILAVLALVCGFAGSLVQCRRAGLDPGLAATLLCVASPFIFLGGKLQYVWMEGQIGDLRAWVGPGYGLYGALAAVLATWGLARLFQVFPLLRFLDCVTPSAALGLTLFRLGCYLEGCCSGVECSLPWAVRYPTGTTPYLLQVSAGKVGLADRWSLPVHPYQLYEAAFGLFCFLFLMTVSKRRLKPGSVFFLGSVLYGAFRFLLEPLRAGFQPSGFLDPLSCTQVISLVVACGAFAAFLLRAARGSGPGSVQANGRSNER